MFQDGPIAVVVAKPFSNPSCTPIALLRDSLRVFLEFLSIELHRFAFNLENVPYHLDCPIRPFTCLNQTVKLIENKRQDC